MCLATPLKIQLIKETVATVQGGDKTLEVSLRLLPQAKVGDWVLVHGNIAINIIPEKEAKEILKLIRKTESACK